MGGQESKLTGPDLEAGIPEADLAGEAPLLGHARGEAVLLVRRNEEVLAIGATCTHYGGPLAEGLFGGDTVRCPWHHACFDLRTGAPVRAPALNPIPCYEVAVADGLIRVGARTGGPITLRRSSSLRTIAIVGAGAAGESAAETLRREGYDGEILLFGGDESPPVDRPNLSKDYLAGTAPEEWMPLRPPAFFGEQKIALSLGARVDAIDPAGHKLTLADGRDVSWDALLIATGADPVRPPIPGGDQPHVLTLRTLSDSVRRVSTCGWSPPGSGGRIASAPVAISSASQFTSRPSARVSLWPAGSMAVTRAPSVSAIFCSPKNAGGRSGIHSSGAVPAR